MIDVLEPPVPEDMVKNGRLFGGTFIFGALVLGGFEWHSIREFGRFAPYSVIIGSFCLVMGLAGLIQPGLLWSLSARRKELPRTVRWVGISLAIVVAGLAAGGIWFLRGGRLF